MRRNRTKFVGFSILLVVLVIGTASATVPGQPWWFPDYYYSVDHVASPDVFESSIAWDRSNDNGEWFSTLKVYDHEIRWGGSEWSSESELRSKYTTKLCHRRQDSTFYIL
jgi:hypothetical protein